jgi:hypothetical protein
MHTFESLFVRLPTRIYGLTKGEGIDGDRYGGGQVLDSTKKFKG